MHALQISIDYYAINDLITCFKGIKDIVPLSAMILMIILSSIVTYLENWMFFGGGF